MTQPSQSNSGDRFVRWPLDSTSGRLSIANLAELVDVLALYGGQTPIVWGESEMLTGPLQVNEVRIDGVPHVVFLEGPEPEE